MNCSQKIIYKIALVSLLLCAVFNQASIAQEKTKRNLIDPLSGKDLSHFDFLLAGAEPTQSLYIVKDGKIAWQLPEPKGKGQVCDAVLMTNGNILYAHQYGITLISPDQKVLWHYDTPEGCETHTAQPIGKKYVVFVQNGNTAKVFVVNVKNGETVKTFDLPVKDPKNVHGQFRHARLTKNGTLLVAHIDLGKVCEYDINGKELWSLPTPGIWSVEPLENNNILISSSKLGICEIDRGGNVVWEIPAANFPDFHLTHPQVVIRRPNGNTLIANWSAIWGKTVDLSNQPFQVVEVSPDKKIVWTLQTWEDPNNLGDATIVQVLDEKGISEHVHFGKYK